MGRIELTISPDYQSQEWGLWEVVREIIANARDAQTKMSGDGRGKMGIRYDRATETLYVTTYGVKVASASLLMGFGDSRQYDSAIGIFGEGLPMAMMTAARLPGVAMTVINDDEKWEPVIERSQTFNHHGRGVPVVVVNTRKLPKSHGSYEVQIKGLGAELWDEYRQRFLFLDPVFDPKVHAAGAAQAPGEILLLAKHKGMIYNKGVYVCSKKDLAFGYNLRMKLNRDRSLIDEWDLKFHLSKLTEELVKANPDRFKATMLALLEKGEALEIQESYYIKNGALGMAAVAKFRGDHGEKAIPVSSMAEAKEAEFVGLKGVVVSNVLKTVLSAHLGDFATATNAAKVGFKKVYQWNELTDEEKRMLERVTELLTFTELGCDFNYMASLKVVDYSGEDIEGTHHGREGTAIARKMLADFKDALQVAVHEVAHNYGGDGSVQHQRAENRLYASIIAKLTNE